jgi:hypothetical protein
MHTYIPTYIHTYIHTYIIYSHTYLIHMCIHTYSHKYLFGAAIHPYIHAYLFGVAEVLALVGHLFLNLLPVARVLATPLGHGEAAGFAALLPQFLNLALHRVANILQSLVSLFTASVGLLTCPQVLESQLVVEVCAALLLEA